MNYGCIGEHLGHSYSKEIHEMIGSYEYELKEIAKAELGTFITERNYRGLNVTIPYKEEIMRYLDVTEESAKKIGAVNTVVNRDGVLCGYNTDYAGLKALLEHTQHDFFNKKVLILGTGGTSKTAQVVLKDLKAGEIIFVSRTGKDGAVTYEQAAVEHSDASFILNTTPCGMYPKTGESPMDLNRFYNLKGVIDVIYNPMRTKLMLQAERMGIQADGGLYMLVVQAVRAAELFQDTVISNDRIDKIYRAVRNRNENIVLIGMPGCGKSTIGKMLSQALGMNFIDTDKEVERNENRTIREIFETDGEPFFRKAEREVIKECSKRKNHIIATGGGVILNEKNVEDLKATGRLILLNRFPENLTPTEDRPLADSDAKIRRLYSERMPMYLAAADRCTDADLDLNAVAEEIRRYRNEY